jgi:transcription elongation factor Elf1
MARYYVHPCDLCKEHKSMRLIERSDEFNVLECDTCGARHDRKAAQVPKKKTTWPYYHEGAGVRFESESHEQKYAAANNLTKE